MKQFIFSIMLLLSIQGYCQDLTLEESSLIFTALSPIEAASMVLSSGNIILNALGTPGGQIVIQDEGPVGVNVSNPQTALHVKQLSGTKASQGIRLESVDGLHHWTIEINELDNELDFYYNGGFAAAIGTNGDYNNPAFAPKNHSESKYKEQGNPANSKSLKEQLNVQEKTIQSLQAQIRILEQKVSSLIN